MNIKNIITYRLIIKGRVQGVGFRYWFTNLAISYSLKGYVKNLKNPNVVEAIIQGSIKDIQKIINKCKEGSKYTLVESIIRNKIVTNVLYSEFITKYDT